MGLFSKEECCFCGAKVGVLSRFKIKSGEFMCQDCQKKGNPFMHLASMNKDEIGLLFEECEQGEAHFQEVKNYCRKVSRGTISKTWTIYDNFQTGEFYLETPESHLYPRPVSRQLFPSKVAMTVSHHRPYHRIQHHR